MEVQRQMVTIEQVEIAINSLKAKRRMIAVDLSGEIEINVLAELYGRMICDHANSIEFGQLTDEQRRVLIRVP